MAGRNGMTEQQEERILGAVRAWVNASDDLTRAAQSDDVAAVALPIFRHRIIPNFSAQSEGVTSDDITRKILEAPLQRGIEGELMNAARGRRRDHGVGRVRCQHRHQLASGRHRLAARALDLVERHNASGGDAIEHAVAGVARDPDRDVASAPS